ncbi:hypothetical protein Mal65_32010 [Crateriforma conspicua]|nr:hypothetical protein Mal65_32010 [Crateriforma conspicua]
MRNLSRNSHHADTLRFHGLRRPKTWRTRLSPYGPALKLTSSGDRSVNRSVLLTAMILLLAGSSVLGISSVCDAADDSISQQVDPNSPNQTSSKHRSADSVVTIQTLLKDMVDRDGIARFPAKNFRLRQHSSYNRDSKTPDDPKGWFANGDFNRPPNGKNFIRTEVINGKKEWVLMDHDGPGAIVRTWMPWQNQKNGGTDLVMRIYLDGESEPALEGNMLGMFDGTGVIPYPFAHPSLRSAVNFFPIPYAKSCKVTVSQMPFFYQFTFREYDEGTTVETFTLDDFRAAENVINDVGNALLHPNATGTTDRQRFRVKMAGSETMAYDLPPGTAAVRELSVKLADYDDAMITRNVVLKMDFDGKETVWCPIGEFFGTGIGLNPFQGWYRTVAKDGTMTCRWVMPYQTHGTVSLINLGSDDVVADLEFKTGRWNWDERSMYFHANWRGQCPVPTRPFSDWNYVTLKGRGVYVGDTLTVMNPVERWWGEGDEKIFVDGEAFPSIFGTGTEDYYGYSWGGRSTDFYEHPFHAQPFSHRYNKQNRKPNTDERNTLGYSTETRTRVLDTMPFSESLQLDMEVWSWSECDMGYAAGTYWYGFSGTTSNRQPAPDDATQRWVVPPRPPSSESTSSSDATQYFENAIECESLSAVANREGVKLIRDQNLGRYGKHQWSGGRHLFVRDTEAGDFVDLKVAVPSERPFELRIHATTSFDYGILDFSVDGQTVGKSLDTYSAKVGVTGPVTLGRFTSNDKEITIRIEVAGSNPNAKVPGTFFGLDCLIIEPVTP